MVFQWNAKVTSVLSVDIFLIAEACARHFLCVFLITDIMMPAGANTESEEQSEDQGFHKQLNPLVARRGSVTCRTLLAGKNRSMVHSSGVLRVRAP